ncbi:hypothetical protein [Paraburkholderia sp. HP33-1]|uniref:hypothetical protein n=1 Tax=Paraburkholderia sp. HP33-1 TaxID=2883243 RepID=UPI001F272E63|nr:hypothetical protein [Paraburkholderia sp. HP33-1]
MRPEQRFGLTVGNESGHYIFTLWPQRLFVGHRAMQRAARRRYHADFRKPPSEPARSRVHDAARRKTLKNRRN